MWFLITIYPLGKCFVLCHKFTIASIYCPFMSQISKLYHFFALLCHCVLPHKNVLFWHKMCPVGNYADCATKRSGKDKEPSALAGINAIMCNCYKCYCSNTYEFARNHILLLNDGRGAHYPIIPKIHMVLSQLLDIAIVPGNACQLLFLVDTMP